MIPHRLFYIGALGLFLISFIGFFVFMELEPLLALALSLNVSTFFLFGYDKAAARSASLRVPESVLISLALMGGSPAILIGMQVFRHKTRDSTFLPPLVIVIVLQIALAAFLLVP